jgi:phenylacetate-CoA ligase
MRTTPRSSVRDVVWPAIVTGQASTVLAVAFQLEQSQWWSAEELQAQQYRQLAPLLRHARTTVPFYQNRFDDAGLTGEQPITPESWLRIPLLTRQDVRQRQADLTSNAVPRAHGKSYRNKTSGSTGEPLEVIGTQINGLFWQSVALRDDFWQRRALGGGVVAIRSGRYKSDPLAVHDLPTWGLNPPTLYKTGPLTIFYHLTPIPRQAELLEARNPHYILTYPSNARALCQHARKHPVRLPSLEALHTYGEVVTPGIRAACRETLGVPVQDVYSCEELGFIALQCPQHDHYHVQSETVLVEVLDEQGNPCAPGEIGSVVLTTLHNLAMPLIRYAIGDHAEVGGPCPCGRGLPVLKRILGRRRNQVILPDGRRTWPDRDALWAAIPDVEQIQVVQTGEDHVEVRYARQEPLSTPEEQALGPRIHQALGHPFRLTISHHDAIARQPNGKYETFFDAR